MPVLNQIIAHHRGAKNRVNADVDAAYHLIQRASTTAKLDGVSRIYQPKDEEGEQFPSESTRVQVKVTEVLDGVAKRLTELFDATATLEWGNQSAYAHLMVEDNVLLAEVPVPYLLFLDKQLTDLHTVVGKLPTLDPAYDWTWDANEGVYKTEPAKTIKSKKIPRNHVKAEATEKHPAQVEVYYEDTLVGEWSTVKSSGALPATRVRELLGRIETLQKAVKYAREQGNNREVTAQKTGEKIFGYLFA